MAPLRAAPHPSWMDALMYFNALDGDQQSWSAAVSLNRVSTESGQGQNCGDDGRDDARDHGNYPSLKDRVRGIDENKMPSVGTLGRRLCFR